VLCKNDFCRKCEKKHRFQSGNDDQVKKVKEMRSGREVPGKMSGGTRSRSNQNKVTVQGPTDKIEGKGGGGRRLCPGKGRMSWNGEGGMKRPKKVKKNGVRNEGASVKVLI